MTNFLPENTPITPREKSLLNKPEIQSLIDKFSLEIIPSKQYLRNVEIESRVEKLLKGIK
jgi:hypothetical protein